MSESGHFSPSVGLAYHARCLEEAEAKPLKTDIVTRMLIVEETAEVDLDHCKF